MNLKVLEKQEPQITRWKEVVKIRVEINEMETKRLQRINERNSWFFEKVNKIDKPLAK
jgi:hypothetical protein